MKDKKKFNFSTRVVRRTVGVVLLISTALILFTVMLSVFMMMIIVIFFLSGFIHPHNIEGILQFFATISELF